MRKIFTVLFIIALFFVIFYSCVEEEDDCMDCRYVKTENGVIIETGTYSTYCGDELQEILNEEPAIVDDLKTEWECK